MTEMDTAIVTRRNQGKACRVVASELGITESQVWRCMQRMGMAGKIRAALPPKPEWHRRNERPVPLWRMEEALRKFGSVTIEEGAGGGYIVTVGDWTGSVCETLSEALMDATEACL